MLTKHGSTTRAGVLPFTLFLGLVLAAAGACSSQEPKKPCPEEGIGVKSAAGVSCRAAAADITSADWKDCTDQIENYSGYGCDEPQLCPDLSKVVLDPYKVDPAAVGAMASFLLTNCSTGTQNLVVSKMVVYGDSRCSFTEPELGEMGNVAKPGESIAIRTVYKPKSSGADHAEIRIYSNAQNFPVFKIAVCGEGVPLHPPGQDAGVYAPDGGVGGAVVDCESVGDNLNQTCHSDQNGDNPNGD